MLPLPCRLITYAKRVLWAFTSDSPLPSLSLSPPPPLAVIVVLAFVLSARNVMRNCLCVLGVYDIIFVFLSVRLCFSLSLCLSLCVCRCVLVYVYKLHYTTSNITNDNKHLADTTQRQQQQQGNKNNFIKMFFSVLLPPSITAAGLHYVI